MRRKSFLAESQSLWQQRKYHQAEVRQRRLQIQKEKYEHQLQAAGRGAFTPPYVIPPQLTPTPHPIPPHPTPPHPTPPCSHLS